MVINTDERLLGLGLSATGWLCLGQPEINPIYRTVLRCRNALERKREQPLSHLDLITSAAVEEAYRFHRKLCQEVIVGQLSTLLTLALMAYFRVSSQWLIVTGFFVVTGTLTNIVLKCALRFDAGRAYLELWTQDVERYGINR
jgi:hypothetical protein